MNRRTWMIFLVAILIAVLVGAITFNCMCSGKVDRLRILEERKGYLEWEIEGLAQQIVWLESEIALLEEEWKNMKLLVGETKYLLTLKITYESGTGLWSHLHGPVSMTAQIPVDKAYYEFIEIGSVLHDDFKMGRFTWAGSSGDWEIIVTDKEIVG